MLLKLIFASKHLYVDIFTFNIYTQLGAQMLFKTSEDELTRTRKAHVVKQKKKSGQKNLKKDLNVCVTKKTLIPLD